MKSVRQEAILQIIRKENIETQEELARALNRHGYNVTQATVSRDIREMGLTKAQRADGAVYYTAPEPDATGLEERYRRMLEDSLLSVDASGTMIVVKTLSGSANIAAEALDGMSWTEVLGSIAGDNTVFLVARSVEEVPDVVSRIQAMMH